MAILIDSWIFTLWYGDMTPAAHETVGAARLIQQYRGARPRLQAALAAYLGDIQDLEDVTFEVLTGVWPRTAVGVQLDNVGRIVGHERGELSDDRYRIFIIARILVNRSNGTIPELLEVLDLFVTSTIFIDESYSPSSPGSSIRVDLVETADGDLIGQLVRDWKAAGVELFWVWSDYAETSCFAMGDTLSADETNATGGFGDITGATQSSGGYMSGSQS